MGKIIVQVSEADKQKEDVEKIIFLNNHLYSGAYDGTLKKWTKDLTLVKEWKAHECTIYSMATNGTNLIFTSSTDGEIKEWNEEGQMLQMVIMKNPMDEKPTEVKCLDWKNGFLFAGDMSGIARKFKPNFVQESEKISFSEIWSVAATPNGETVFLARDNTVIASDIDVEALPGEQSISGRRRLPHEQPMPFFTATFQRPEFQQTLDVRGSFEGRAPVICNDELIACVDRKGMSVRVYDNDGKTYPQKAHLQGHEMILNALLLYKSGHLVSSGWDGKVKLWNIVEQKEMDQVELGFYVNTLCGEENDSINKVVYCAGKAGMIAKVQF